MTTVLQVRDGMADAITDATGLRSSAYVPDQMVAPIAVVSRRAFDPRLIFSGAVAPYAFTVTIYVDRTNERAAQEQLDAFCDLAGEVSVVAAIQDGDNWDESLGVHYAQVVQVGEVTAAALGESQYLAAQLDVEVVW